MILTKAYVVDSIEDQLGFTKQQSIDTVKTLLEIIKQNLKSGGNIFTSGSGKFCISALWLGKVKSVLPEFRMKIDEKNR